MMKSRGERKARGVRRLGALCASASLAVAACGSSAGPSPLSAGAPNAGSAGSAAARAGADSGGTSSTSGAPSSAGAANAGAGNAGAPNAGASASGAGGTSASNGGSAGSGGTSGMSGSAAASGSAGGGGAPPLPPHTGKWRVVPLGDSITGTTCGPQLLSKALTDKGKTNFEFVGSNLNNQSCNGAPSVQSEGHGGYLVTDLVGNGSHASELPAWCSADKADLVLMQFGTNDVWSNRSPESILSAYSTVLTDLRTVNPNVTLLIAQITPLNPGPPQNTACAACESRVVALNAQIPSWASSQSTAASPVLVVDIHAAFTASSYVPNSMYTTDGVHPNIAGAQLIAGRWLAALSALGAP